MKQPTVVFGVEKDSVINLEPSRSEARKYAREIKGKAVRVELVDGERALPEYDTWFCGSWSHDSRGAARHVRSILPHLFIRRGKITRDGGSR